MTPEPILSPKKGSKFSKKIWGSSQNSVDIIYNLKSVLFNFIRLLCFFWWPFGNQYWKIQRYTSFSFFRKWITSNDRFCKGAPCITCCSLSVLTKCVVQRFDIHFYRLGFFSLFVIILVRTVSMLLDYLFTKCSSKRFC